MDEMNYFKQSFKFFKRKHNPEILNNVVSIDAHCTPEFATRDLSSDITLDKCKVCVNLGLRSHYEWQIYRFKGLGGFIYIRNPFSVNGQQYWVQKCLTEYTRKPSLTNLDLHHPNLDDIWLSPQLVDKLTWVTLGYHYNWDEKTYDRTRFSSFPKCLGDLVKHIASCLNFPTFQPDAAIINYYNAKSTLGIHNDHSEKELNEPIVSISFGLTAIFLIGTERINEKPLPIFLKSGDIVLLSGESRLAYHAVPAVIPELANYCDEENESTWKGVSNYIKQHRINISVRQVYPTEIKI